MKRAFLFLLLISCAGIILAQDIVVTKAGTTIEDVTVILVTADNVTYMQAGTQKSIASSEVDGVLYSDGRYVNPPSKQVVSDTDNTVTAEDAWAIYDAVSESMNPASQTTSSYSEWEMETERTPSYTRSYSDDGGRNIFVGINGTIGFPITMGTIYQSNQYYDVFGFGTNIKLGLDFAYPVADRFAIGAYFNLGGGFSAGDGGPGGSFDFKFGVLMLAGNVNDLPFIIGLSPCLGYGFNLISEYVPLEVRFGRAIKEHVYITGNLNMGIPIHGGFVLEPGITVGYHFGDMLKN